MGEKFLDDTITSEIRKYFNGLDKPVQLYFFGKKENCLTCNDTLQLLKEVADLSDKIYLKVYDLDTDAVIAQQYHIDKSPGVVIAVQDGDNIIDYGIRYYGIPAGNEFSAFINDITRVSSQVSGLMEETKKFLHSIKDPLRFLIFTTPT